MEERKSTAFGIGFLIAFLSAVIAMVYNLQHNPPVGIFIFGAIFFGVGTLVLVFNKIKLENVWVVLLPLIGLGCMVVSATYIWDLSWVKDMKIDREKLAAFLIILLFFLVGVYICFMGFYSNHKKKRIYAYSVLAKCIDLETYTAEGSIMYMPVFQYTYNGIEYIYKVNYGVGIKTASVGKCYKLLLNPNNPSDALFPLKIFLVLSLILGGGFAVVAIVSGYYLIFK